MILTAWQTCFDIQLCNPVFQFLLITVPLCLLISAFNRSSTIIYPLIFIFERSFVFMVTYVSIFVKERRRKPYGFMILLKHHKSRREYNKLTLDQQQMVVERMIAAAKEVGHPHNHPLKRVACTQYTQNIRSSLQTVVDTYIAQLNSIQACVKQLVDVLGEKEPES